MKGNALLLFLLVALATQLQAQATLSVQGTLQKSFGAAVDDGEYSLTFKLYTSATGGSSIWDETHDEVEVTGGVYSVLLGSVSVLNVPFNQPYFLGVAVDGGTELIPRARLTSSPYALSLIGQSNAFPSAGAVGIGTATPISAVELHIKDGSGDAELQIESPNNVARLSLKDADQTGEVSLQNNTLNLKANGMPLDLSGTTVSLKPSSGNVNLQSGGGEQAQLGLSANGFQIQANGALKLILGSNNKPVLELFEPEPGIARVSAAMGMTKLHLGLESQPYITMTEGSSPNFPPGSIGNPRLVSLSSNLEIEGGLHVKGIRTVPAVAHYYLNSGGTGPNPGGGNMEVGISCASSVNATSFRATSDRRIKKNFRLSDGAGDLAALRRLRITDYQYVDEVAKGSSFYKGLVAQEVMEIMPAAVGTTSDFVPDIFSPAQSISCQDGQLTMHTSREHQLKAGDQVRLILEEGAKEYTVTATPDARSFAVSWTDAAPEMVFVYGKRVDDFHQVDYDQVHNLSISAIQELARRLEQLEQENAVLRLKNATLQGQNDGLRSDVDGMNERLLKLETLVTGSAQR